MMGLAFIQLKLKVSNYCYRNFFTLTPAHLEQLLAAFEASLQDDKLEIRTLASNTLSGLIKVLPPRLFEAVKSKIVKEAQAAFPGRKQQPANAPTIVQLHSCVLKLAALLQSNPYELADWCVAHMLPPTVYCDVHAESLHASPRSRSVYQISYGIAQSEEG